MKEGWEIVVGLEIHVQVNSNTKAFVDDKNEFGADENIHISPITLAHPGTLPRVNTYHIHSGVKIGLALNGKINHTSFFDRKNYFYPDLPKGYQITQDQQPISVGGSMEYILTDGTIKSVRIHHLHMEEDAGKSIHDIDPKATLLDFNRAGVPLLEIVTEPDLRSSEEVYAFIQYMQWLVQYLNISDGNMEEGSFRCDCNVSVMKTGSKTLGTRCEIKNLNSKKFAKQAVDYEANRQIALLEKGEKITQTTLLFNPELGKTFPMRDKEEVNDYRYFNDPDLPPVSISSAEVETIKASIDSTPVKSYLQLKNSYGLDHDQIETIIGKIENLEIFNKIAIAVNDNREFPLLYLNKLIPDDQFLKTYAENPEFVIERIKSFIALINANKISKSAAYQHLYPLLWTSVKKSLDEIAAQHELLLTTEALNLQPIIEEIFNEFPKKVKEYKQGKKGLIGFFIGQVKRKAMGNIDPKRIQGALLEQLEK